MKAIRTRFGGQHDLVWGQVTEVVDEKSTSDMGAHDHTQFLPGKVVTRHKIARGMHSDNYYGADGAKGN